MCRSTIVVPPALVLALWAGAARSTEPVRVVDEAVVRDARRPRTSIDRDGGIHVVSGSGDSIYHAASDDAKAFGPPVKVASEGKLSLGMRRGRKNGLSRG